MKILITGAAGLLGQKLIDRLSMDPTIELVVTRNHAPLSKKKHYRILQLNITNPLVVQHTITTVKPDVVIHAAAMTQVDRCEQEREACWKVNTLAVAYLTDACKEINAHFILLSSDFVFDGKCDYLDETAVPNPINYYGKSKLEAEKTVRRSGLKWTIIRTALVYGANPISHHRNIVLWVKEQLEKSNRVHMVNDQRRTPTLAEDLATGCYRIACKGAQGIYHISGEEVLTPYDIAIRTATFFKLDTSLIKATDSNAFTQPAQRPLTTGFVITKAKNTLHYQPHSLYEGLCIVNNQLAEN